MPIKHITKQYFTFCIISAAFKNNVYIYIIHLNTSCKYVYVIYFLYYFWKYLGKYI